jgi:crotonobetainyl-CoA:carnitine CoA-transferase CaiB-like acyl-CoA transferase
MPGSLPPRTEACLTSLLAAADWPDAPVGQLGIAPSPTLIASPLPIADLAAAALGAVGLAASEIDRRRSGRRQTIAVDRSAASLAMASSDYLRIDPAGGKRWDPVTGYHRAGDGEWVYLHGNFPHLRDGLLDLFGAPEGGEALGRALAKLPGQEIEDRAAGRGLCAVLRRDRAAWEAHPQARAVRALPVVRIERIGEAPAEPLAPGPRPLSGIRALDLTRVIAGPMAGRTLAELGATVLRIAAPHLPFIEPLVVDTGFGKLSAHLDLNAVDGRERLEVLVRGADVFIDSYRPGALAARGLGPADLAHIRPGIVTVSVSAFSSTGPWAGRRGYDTLVQAAAGFSTLEGNGPPVRQPCQPLDYLSGYLAAFGAMRALLRRAEEGGSWHVEVSLARTAQWIRDMTDAIGPEPAPPPANPERASVSSLLGDWDTVFGRVSALRPAYTLSQTPPRRDRPPVPLGTDLPVWP